MFHIQRLQLVIADLLSPGVRDDCVHFRLLPHREQPDCPDYELGVNGVWWRCHFERRVLRCVGQAQVCATCCEVGEGLVKPSAFWRGNDFLLFGVYEEYDDSMNTQSRFNLARNDGIRICVPVHLLLVRALGRWLLVSLCTLRDVGVRRRERREEVE